MTGIIGKRSVFAPVLFAVCAILVSGETLANASMNGARHVASLVQKGEWELASKHATVVLRYQLSHRTAPDAVPAAISMANSLTQLGRYTEAIRVLEPLGSNAAVVAARGTILFEQGKYAESDAAFARALRDPSALPRYARARVTCERAFALERRSGGSAASAGYLEALKLYAQSVREKTFFLGRPRVGGTVWDQVAPKPGIVSGPVGQAIAELDRLGEPNSNPGYWPEAFSTYLMEEDRDGSPRGAPFVECLIRAARQKDAAGERDLAHVIFQTAIAQASVLDGLGYSYRSAMAFNEYFEFLERANFDPKRLEQMATFALFADINPSYSESDIRKPAAPTTSPRMKAYQLLNAVRLRSLFRSGDMSDTVRDNAFEVAQDYQKSTAALAVHRHSPGRTHPRDPAVFTKAEHEAFWAQFDRALPGSASLSTLRMNSGQVLLMVSPGAGTGSGRIWAKSESRTAWAATNGDRESLRADIENLRCALDTEMCCRFPAASRMGAAYLRLRDAFKVEFRLRDIGVCPLRDEHFEAGIAYRVFEKIFADPVIREMVAKADELIIVPHGELASIPFGALPMTKPKSGRGPAAAASATWLGLEKAISIYPSIASYEDGKAMPSIGRFSLFAVGDPLLGDRFENTKIDCTQSAPRTRRTRGASDGDPMLDLAPLPGTKCELVAISKLDGVLPPPASTVLLGPKATERAFRATARARGSFSEADVLVFATHGLMRGDFGLDEQALVLSRPRRSGRSDIDGFLTLSEIMQLHMRSKIVILSACNTGSSGEAAGDAMAGFATAFFRAGAESVLMSQWTVRDDVAAFVTPRLVALMRGKPAIAQCQRTAKQRSTAESMRIALCEARHNQALGADLPRDWAPFVLVGGQAKL